MAVTALILAAGRGERLGGDVPKQFRLLGGKPVLRWALEALAGHPRIDAVRLVVGQGQRQSALEAASGIDIGEPILGGASRSASVANGLREISSTHVLVHDAARPFCPPAVVDRLLGALEQHEAAVPVLAVADTLARADALPGMISGQPIERAGAVRVQTPQAFVTERLRLAHAQWSGDEPTDDAMVARALGMEVAAVEGDPLLDKLTSAADFARAEALLAMRLEPRSGIGFDVHAFGGEGPLMLGGIAVPHPRGLAGHSDADVLLHAITDALLGAAALGDIGEHFPPSDPRWKGASSAIFLAYAAALVRSAGAIIDHVDCILICEEPRIGPHRPAMRRRIAAILGLDESRVSVKATTTERLGFTGRGEGIAAQAIASIRMGNGR